MLKAAVILLLLSLALWTFLRWSEEESHPVIKAYQALGSVIEQWEQEVVSEPLQFPMGKKGAKQERTQDEPESFVTSFGKLSAEATKKRFKKKARGSSISMEREELKAHLDANEARMESLVNEVKNEARVSREANEKFLESLKREVAEAEKTATAAKKEVDKEYGILSEKVSGISRNVNIILTIISILITVGILIFAVLQFTSG